MSYKLGYNNIDQLLSTSATGQCFGYGYDPAGNRQTETTNEVTTAVYNAANQIEQVTPAITARVKSLPLS